MAYKILVVEDEKPMSKALVLKLTNSGYEVDSAYDGQEALAMIAKKKYDLMLLDLMMPIKGGFEVMQELDSNKNEIKIIVTTNLSQEEDKEKAKKLGAVDFLVKSDTPLSKIVEKVKALLK